MTCSGSHNESVAEVGFEPGTSWLQALFFNHWTTQPPQYHTPKHLNSNTYNSSTEFDVSEEYLPSTSSDSEEAVPSSVRCSMFQGVSFADALDTLTPSAPTTCLPRYDS